MDLMTWIFTGITLLFFVILSLKNILNLKKACAICLSVTLTWIVLLTLYFLEVFNDKIIIAILMGHTSLGIYYVLEKRVKKRLLLFRLPLLLTFIFIIYSILESFSFNSLIFLMVLWLIFSLIYLFRSNSGFSKFANKLIECCKKW